MRKFALLIGMSQYDFTLDPLPSAGEDVKAMKRVLQNPDLGDFAEDDIELLINSKREDVEAAIYRLFNAARQRDDLLVFYFSGHGFTDEAGKLFLTTSATQQDEDGYVIQHTAIDSRTIQDYMSRSRSNRQVLILDCCFSGAFARGMTVKGDVRLDVTSQFSGKGRAILTSSGPTKYSFHQQGFTLSTYTHYLVEGIETGAADQDRDGWINVDELHQYVSKQIAKANVAMSPQFFPVEEGYKISLAKAPSNTQSTKKHILFLPSNFKQPGWKHLSRELFAIQEHLELTNSNRLYIRRSNSALVEDFHKVLHEVASRREVEIIHFSGHVADEGIVLENEPKSEIPINSESWIHMFKSVSRNISCIVLSGCYIEEQAKKIGRYIDNVIGISSHLSERDSHIFLKYFYYELSSGKSIESSFAESYYKSSEFVEEAATLIIHIRKQSVLEEAVKTSKEKLKSTPNDLRLLISISADLAELNRYAEAIEIYDRALAIEGSNTILIRQKALALDEIGRYSDALEVCEEGLRIAAEDCSLLRQKSLALRHLKRHEEALLILNKVLKIEPQSYIVWIERGDLLEELSRIEQAIQSYEKSLELSPHNKSVINKRNSLKDQFESQNQEERDAQNSTQIQSDNYEDWLIEAYLLESMGLYEDSIAAYRKALELKSDSINVLIQLGKVLQKIGKLQDAVDIFDQVLIRHPNNYVVRTYRGIALRDLLHNQEAVISFKQSLKSNPNYRAAKYEQRWTYRSKEQ